MWKLLPVLLLVSCATNDRQPPVGGDNQAAQGRIVLQDDLRITPSEQAEPDQPARITFRRQGMSGWLDQTGEWHIRREVRHNSLRCGTYETGIQIGRGSPACAGVEWLTDVSYVTRLRHCNSATRLHEGGGRFTRPGNALEGVSCVRVVVRCEGTC